MKQDGDSVVFKAPESSSICFNALDNTIEAFCGRIGDAVLQLSDDVFKVLLDHFGDALDWFELAATSPSITIKRTDSIRNSCVY